MMRLHVKRQLLATMLLLTSYMPDLLAQSKGCYWIQLDHMSNDYRMDVFSWGEYAPMIALEPGEHYLLLPGTRDTTLELSGGRATDIDSHWYYIPRHLVKDNRYLLRFMLIERDADDDDLVLPMRSHIIDLAALKLNSGRQKNVIVDEQFVADGSYTVTAKVSFRFNIRRGRGECYANDSAAQKLDEQKRNENRLHHLHSRIKHHAREPLIAGFESRLFLTDEVRSLEEAYIVAKRNFTELITLGKQLFSLQNTNGFAEVEERFLRLVDESRQNTIKVPQKMKDKDGKTVFLKVPALVSESGWKQYLIAKGAEKLPDAWLY